MIRDLSEVSVQNPVDAMRSEIERLVPEHVRQYVPFEWLLAHPELADGKTVVCPNISIGVVDWPGYTAAMSDRELAPAATDVVDRFQSEFLKCAKAYGYDLSLNSAGDEQSAAGTPQEPLVAIDFGLAAQILFMDILEDVPDLRAFIEKKKGRRPALIHFADAAPRNTFESLMVRMVSLGNERIGFLNGGSVLKAKSLASTGFVTTSSGRLHIGGTGNDEWGKNGPDVILTGGIDPEEREFLKSIGLAVTLGPRDLRGQSEYVTIEVPLGGDIRAIQEELHRNAPEPAIPAKESQVTFPPNFAQITALLASMMAPKFQRGDSGKSRPDHVREGVNTGGDGIFSFTHWDHLHQKLIEGRERIIPGGKIDEQERDTAIMAMIGEAIAHVAETAVRPFDTRGISAKEIECTTDYDVYLIWTHGVEAPCQDAQKERSAMLIAANASMRALQSDGFKKSLSERMASVVRDADLPLGKRALLDVVESTHVHTDLGISIDQEFLVEEPECPRRGAAYRIPAIRGKLLPDASRKGGFKGKNVYRSRIRELEASAKVHEPAPEEQQELAALAEMRTLADENCIIMERNDAVRLGVNFDKVRHIDLPHKNLKGMPAPVDLIAIFPNLQ